MPEIIELTAEEVEQRAEEFYAKYIVDINDCGCEDCCANAFEDIQDELFSLFELDVIPQRYRFGDRYEFSSSFSNFYDLWCGLYKLSLYNKRLLKDNAESGTNKSLVSCYECGKLTYKNKNRVYKDHQLCIPCARSFKECHYCKDLLKLDQWDSDRCMNTLDFISEEDTKRIYVCSTCYEKHHLKDHQCDGCRRYSEELTTMKRLIRKRDNNDKLVYTKYCIKCGRELQKCNVLGCDEFAFNGKIKCSACDEEDVGLNRYDYKPIRRIFNHSVNEKHIDIDTSMFFGFELETESPCNSHMDISTMAHLVRERVGRKYVYCMTDGSLRNGIEIASFPFTWDWYKKVGKDKWTDLLLFLKDKGWRGDFPDNTGDSSNSVGFHVHTTKAAWSKLQIYKLIQFMYNPVNRKFVSLIAGREPMTYCRISEVDWDRSVLLAKNKKNVSEDHYNMINLNKKSNASEAGHTIEFRMFRGVVEPLLFHKNLEFVQAIFCFTRDHSKKEMFEDPFIKFVLKNKKEYPCLLEHFRTKLDMKRYMNSK